MRSDSLRWDLGLQVSVGSSVALHDSCRVVWICRLLAEFIKHVFREAPFKLCKSSKVPGHVPPLLPSRGPMPQSVGTSERGTSASHKGLKNMPFADCLQSTRLPITNSRGVYLVPSPMASLVESTFEIPKIAGTNPMYSHMKGMLHGPVVGFLIPMTSGFREADRCA